MFSSLLRPRNRKKRSESRTPSPVAVRRPLLSNNRRVVENHEEEEDVYDGDMTYDDDDEEGDEDEDDIETPLLPIFASEHLGKRTIYCLGTIMLAKSIVVDTDRIGERAKSLGSQSQIPSSPHLLLRRTTILQLADRVLEASLQQPDVG